MLQVHEPSREGRQVTWGIECSRVCTTSVLHLVCVSSFLLVCFKEDQAPRHRGRKQIFLLLDLGSSREQKIPIPKEVFGNWNLSWSHQFRPKLQSFLLPHLHSISHIQSCHQCSSSTSRAFADSEPSSLPVFLVPWPRPFHLDRCNGPVPPQLLLYASPASAWLPEGSLPTVTVKPQVLSMASSSLLDPPSLLPFRVTSYLLALHCWHQRTGLSWSLNLPSMSAFLHLCKEPFLFLKLFVPKSHPAHWSTVFADWPI